MNLPELEPGEVLFLEREVAGIPWPSGYYVLQQLTEAVATVALVGEDDRGLYAIDNSYAISREDLEAFTRTGERARVSRT